MILRDIEELSYEEIAEVLGVSLGTVKSRLMRGREALRKRLERHLPAFGIDVESDVEDELTASASSRDRSQRSCHEVLGSKADHVVVP